MKKVMISTISVLLLILPCISFTQIQGVWQSEGYGHVLDISTNNMDIYQATSISNIYDDTYLLDGNSIVAGDELQGEFSLDGDKLILTQPGGTIVTFNLLSELPPITTVTDDPQINFEIFWQTYQDWCALFPILSVDWDEQYAYYSALINSSTTDEELFSYMSDLLDQLNDGHSFLDPVNLSGYFDGGPEISPLWVEYEYEMMDLIEAEYIDGGNYIFSNSELISYGRINDSIGYLAINGMEGFSDSDSEFLDNISLNSELDIALTWLQNTQALIIDVRFNKGGYDSNARIIGERLTNKSIPVYTKQVRIGGYSEFADSTVFHIEPNGIQYLDRPIAVLTSDGTLSAADIFALLIREIDCVSLIGEETYGILSDNYTKYLPNNWEFGISPERYKSIANVDYEQLGIPPDIEVIGSMAAFQNNQDNILEVALEQILTYCNVTSVQEFHHSSFQIYPSPLISDYLHVELGEIFSSPFLWSICDLNGNIILEGGSNQENFEIKLNDTPSGMYSLSIVSKEKVSTSRFLKI